MGCDIHMIPEVRKDGYWRAASRLDKKNDFWTGRDSYPPMDRANYFAWEDRHYQLFGILAGVRGTRKPISEPRGLPADMDEDTEEFFDDLGSDGHSRSWLTLAELRAYPWSDAPAGEGWNWDDVQGWIARLGELAEDPWNVRIVFAFDN